MDSKVFQNIIYAAAKKKIVNNSNVFANTFDTVVRTASELYDKGEVQKMYDILVRYFLQINDMTAINNNFADFKYDADLQAEIDKAIQSVKKITQLTAQQIYIIRNIKTRGITDIKQLKGIDTIDDDLDVIDTNTFINSFNNIVNQQDISSILNFIQVNGLQNAYKLSVTDTQSGLVIFKLIYDAINNNELCKQFDKISIGTAYVELASSINDVQLKENCQFLCDEEIEFYVEQNSHSILDKYKQLSIDLTLQNKEYNTVESLFSAILSDDMFISKLSDDELKTVRTKLYEGILNVIKDQKTKLGFPEMIQGNEYSAMQLLNIVLNKKPGAGKTYLEMIEIVFKEDSVDLFKSTGPFEDLTFYEGLYDDFKDIFDNDIHPSSDTGYKITDDVKLFWEAGMKLNKRLNDSQQLDNDSIKPAFQEFGKVALNCSDYMISLKMLFTMLNNVTEERISLLTLLVTIVTADRLMDKIGSIL